jgi:hypothetical protein
MTKKIFLLAVLLFWMAGCAGVDVKKLASPGDYTEGIRFYRPAVYVLISLNVEKKTLQATTLLLPKINEEYVINVRSGLGTVNAQFALTDGWNLTSYGDSRDSKIPEMLNAITGLVKETGVLEKMAGEAPELAPGLYRIEFDEKTGYVKGLVGVFRFKDIKFQGS